jgi:cell division protein FtsB
MTTTTKGPPPGTASGGPIRPDPAPEKGKKVVTLRKALVLGALVALLTGILSAAGATYLARGQIDELDGNVDTLTSEVATLTEQADTLTAQADSLSAQADSLAAEKADLADTLAATQAKADSLEKENAALNQQFRELTGQDPVEPVFADVAYGKVLTFWEGVGTRKSFLLVVDVTVTNPDASKTAYFSAYDLRLRGPDDTVYPLFSQSTFADRSQNPGMPILPGGRIQMQSLELAPSERAKGSVVFYVPKTVTKFTITYHGTSTALTL